MVENKLSEPIKGKTAVLFKTVGSTILLIGIVFSVWAGLRLLQYQSLQGLLRESTLLQFSNFQMGIAFAGLAGLLATVLVQRSRHPKKGKLRPFEMTPMVFGTEKNVHPLIRNPRPARGYEFRDSKDTQPRKNFTKKEWARDLLHPPLANQDSKNHRNPTPCLCLQWREPNRITD